MGHRNKQACRISRPVIRKELPWNELLKGSGLRSDLSVQLRVDSKKFNEALDDFNYVLDK